MKSITDELYKAVELLIDKKLSQLRFDRTVDSRIIDKTEKGYTVMINGVRTTAKSYGDSVYKTGDEVKVLLPQNNINNACILFRKE